MNIRPLDEKDLEIASALCIDAFTVAVAPCLSKEGIVTFNNIASVDSFSTRINTDNTILVCEDNRSIIGLIELKDGSHIAMLFVSPKHQKKGVGRELIYELYSHHERRRRSISDSGRYRLRSRSVRSKAAHWL